MITKLALKVFASILEVKRFLNALKSVVLPALKNQFIATFDIFYGLSPNSIKLLLKKQKNDM